jgi:hypothetical protein
MSGGRAFGAGRAPLYAEQHDLKLSAVVQLALKEYLTHAE